MSDMDVYRAFGLAVSRHRRDLGLTQAQVAHGAGLTRTTLASIETGRQRVQLHQLYGLARALGMGSVTPLLPDMLPGPPEPADSPSIPIAEGSLTGSQREQVSRLVRDLLGQADAVRPTSPGRDAARAAAAEILTRFGVTSPPVPVSALARSLGVRLKYSAMESEISGLSYVSEGTLIVGVNAVHHPNRQRFTLAHELGHITMHRAALAEGVHVDKGILRRDTVSSLGVEPMEIEANRFAAELLMPQHLLDAELGGRQVDLEDAASVKALAKRFGVSEAAMRYRLQA